MATRALNQAKDVGGRARARLTDLPGGIGDAADAGREAARSPWVAKAARLGYVVRGLLYATMGLLAVQVALGAGDRETDQQGALRTLAAQPSGTALLAIVVVGLAGYALWGLIRAVLDPLGKGTDAKGLAQRASFLGSALTYGALCAAATRLLLDAAGAAGAAGGGAAAGQAGGAGTASATAWLLTQPYGAWVIGLVGAWIAGAGLGELYLAYSTDFKKDLRREVMGPREAQLATWAGRIGMAARGVVLGLVGLFVLRAALDADANRARGLDGALDALAASPFGPLLLGAVAIGLVVFGAYSAMCARWMRIRS